jgi:hypothetical protein
MRKFSYKSVQDYFLKENCTLLEDEYIDALTKMKYQCSCDNVSYITFNNFKNGQRCKQCHDNKRRTDYNDVFKYFDKCNCLLLSKEFINVDTPLDYVCSCGTISKIAFKYFKKGQRCRKCSYNKSTTTKRKNLETSGKWVALDNLSEWELYKRTTYNMTEKIYRRNKDLINPNELKRGRGYFHLDHKFTVQDGFKNNIPPFIISNINNLQMLEERVNIAKSNVSEITNQELFLQL